MSNRRQEVLDNQFTRDFIKALSNFVKEQEKEAMNSGLNEIEYKAIATTTFHCLGQNALHFVNKIGD